ncbi:hypothetical protein CROQUDRAFT_88331 [Cronartium quercuum f. sp. fusiforme G11]|uniref:Uncharacterized protein n=1 Tax=Cronartium quercuum f. sp. fusiforme G11 TaxID=708437 RepID=A0A9P6NMV2_9BASI|nr:hypothetical protein CROQUDRAFT_88331 [Cronartium quercuum f. sp. fusiforme G11]
MIHIISNFVGLCSGVQVLPKINLKLNDWVEVTWTSPDGFWLKNSNKVEAFTFEISRPGQVETSLIVSEPSTEIVSEPSTEIVREPSTEIAREPSTKIFGEKFKFPKGSTIRIRDEPLPKVNLDENPYSLEQNFNYRAVASTATVLYFLQRQLPLCSVTCSHSPSSIITFIIDINASRA